MEPTEIVLLIERRRAKLQAELRRLTGIEVDIMAHVHSIGQNPNELVTAAMQTGQFLANGNDHSVWVASKKKSSGSCGETVIWAAVRPARKSVPASPDTAVSIDVASQMQV